MNFALMTPNRCFGSVKKCPAEATRIIFLCTCQAVQLLYHWVHEHVTELAGSYYFAKFWRTRDSHDLVHHWVVPICASIQAGGNLLKYKWSGQYEWRLLKPNFLQASSVPCSDAYFYGNQCTVVVELLVHLVGQLSDMFHKWRSQYHIGASNKITYKWYMLWHLSGREWAPSD